MSRFLADVRLALRGLGKTPAFTWVALLTLGIGIGATTAIFSVVNEVMLRPMSVSEPHRLVMLWESNEERGWHQVHAAPANVLDWREQVRAFEDVAVVSEAPRNVTLTHGDRSVPVTVANVSGNTFSVLGAVPALGRTFTFEESWQSESEPVAVLGHAAWVRYFGADSGIVGRSVRLDGIAFQVIGVLCASFVYPINEAELWTTFRWTAQYRASVAFRRAHMVRAIARVRDGVTFTQAARELDAVAAHLEEQYPRTNQGMKAGFTPLHAFLVGDRRFPLLLLLGGVGMLQLIVCANVANLVLARALVRRQEIAIRCALGAARGQIVRLVLTESAVLAGLGACLGIMLGAFGVDLLATLRPADLPDLVFRLDWRMLSFTSAVAVASALLFGLPPALASASVQPQRQLAHAGRGGSIGRRKLLAAHALTAFEVALAIVLVAAAGLMVRSIARLRQVESGVNMANVLTFEMRPPSGIYPTDADKEQFTQRVIDRLQTLPGVRHAGAGRQLPLTGYGWTSDFTIEGWKADSFGVEVRHREATPGYFRAFDIPLREGSLLPDRLLPDGPVPVLVNQVFADTYFPGQSPVGRRITFNRAADSTSLWYTIAGVVGNERMQPNSEPRPEIIGHLASDTPNLMRFVVKSDASGDDLAMLIRSSLAALDPGVPLLRVRSMDAVALDTLAADRYLMILLGIFAVVALGLAAVGVYGVATQAALARTREIGIRLALGATPTDVVGTLLGRGLLFVACGTVAGLAGARAAGHVLRTLLFGITPGDPITHVSAAAVLALVALGAILLPARRATRLEPRQVLSNE